MDKTLIVAITLRAYKLLYSLACIFSAFGLTVFMRLAGANLKPTGVLLSIVVGFVLAVTLYLLPNTSGDIAERLFPFLAGFSVLLLSGEQQNFSGIKSAEQQCF